MVYLVVFRARPSYCKKNRLTDNRAKIHTAGSSETIFTAAQVGSTAAASKGGPWEGYL